MNVSTRVYDAKYDFIKLILSFFVVAIHSQLYPQLLYPWLRIAVPVFFMISSYFLFSKLNTASGNEQTAIIKGFVIRNVKLYGFWFILLLPVTLYIRREVYFSSGVIEGILVFFKGLFFGSTFVASWYITASVVGVLTVYILSRKLKHGTLFFIVISVFCALTLWSSYLELLPCSDVICRFTDGYELIFGDPVISFPASLFWIFMGKCFAEKSVNLPRGRAGVVILLVSCVGLFAEWYMVKVLTGAYTNDSYFMLLPTCISLFGCIQALGEVKIRYAVYLRRASTVVYVAHGSLLHIIGFAAKRVNIHSTPLLFLAAVGSSVGVYACIELIVHRFPDGKLTKLLKNAY